MSQQEIQQLQSASRETFENAIAFYSRSPDGQYDLLAELCIKYVLEQLKDNAK